MSLNKYTSLLTSGRWSTKYNEYEHKIALVVLEQKLMDYSNNKSENSNREPANREPSYIRDLTPPGLWNIKTGGWLKKPMMVNNIGGARNTALAKVSGSTTSQNITESVSAPHQVIEESPSNQAREISPRATRRQPQLRNSRLASCTSSTKIMSKPLCPSPA